MRILQARFVGPAMMLVALVFFCVSPGIAQKGGGGTSAPSPGKGTPTPAPTPNIPSSTQSQPTTATPQPSRTIWIKGTVMMYDGEAPSESVTIERICSANSVRAEGYTDSKGHFSFYLGQNSGAFADASTANSRESNQSDLLGLSSNSGAAGAGTPNSDTAYWDCELRAHLPGYRSTTVSLAGRRPLDDADDADIVLYPMTGTQGLTSSATSSRAPKEARKAYARGLSDEKKDNLDQAEHEFRKAVQIDTKYAEAWLELGKVLERGERYPEAREAYASSLAGDSKFVYPYQRLYQIALHEQNWKDVADKTDQLLHLDPYEFPDAYYFNALAHFELKEYDAAEKSAQQAVQADWKNVNPKTHYLQGAILVKKKDWTRAAESFRAYLKAAPNATDKAYVEKTLGEIDQQIRRVQIASQESAAQP